MRNPLYFTEAVPGDGECRPIEDQRIAQGYSARTYECPNGGSDCLVTRLRVFGFVVDEGVVFCARSVTASFGPDGTDPFDPQTPA